MGTRTLWQRFGLVLFIAGLVWFIASVVFSAVIATYVAFFLKEALPAQVIAVFALLLAIGSGLMSVGHSIDKNSIL